MGATFSIVLYGSNEAEMASAVDAAFGELQRLERTISLYRPASEWSMVNRWAARRALRISRELYRLLADCMEYSRKSDGSFDISVGPLIRAWGFLEGKGRFPGEAQLAAARANVGYRHVNLDAKARTVRFDRAGVEINPGGIGKGYAVDRMVSILKQRGFDSALVAASGSSIFGLGAPLTESRGWPAEIRDPGNPRKTAETVFLKDVSMSTSGGFEKCFRARGRTYSHILDPRTGRPVLGTGSVSVIAPRALDSEAWTKPCLINGREWTARNKPGDSHVFFCADSAEQAHAWL